MLTDSEIISTLEMLENENLDVRTVTLGINLLDCAGDDPAKVKNKIHSKITHLAEKLVPVCDRVGQKYGIPVVNKRIAVSPIAVVGAALSASQLVAIAELLNDVAQEVNVDFIGGFSALVQKGIAPLFHQRPVRHLGAHSVNGQHVADNVGHLFQIVGSAC